MTTSSRADNKRYIIWSAWLRDIILWFHHFLSLAQLEERKTVTVRRAIVILRPAVRSREGRLFFCFLQVCCINRGWCFVKESNFTDIEKFELSAEGFCRFSSWGANVRFKDVMESNNSSKYDGIVNDCNCVTLFKFWMITNEQKAEIPKTRIVPNTFDYLIPSSYTT